MAAAGGVQNIGAGGLWYVHCSALRGNPFTHDAKNTREAMQCFSKQVGSLSYLSVSQHYTLHSMYFSPAVEQFM